MTFERFSDSAASYITLDPANTQSYKTLFRAAKAKLKLRLRATTPMDNIIMQASGPSVSSPSANFRALRQKHSAKSLSLNPLFSASETTLNNPTGGVRVSSSSSVRIPEIKPEAENEAPVPHPFPARERKLREKYIRCKQLSSKSDFFSELAGITRARDLALRTKEPPLSVPGCSWSVYCNSCDASMPDEHYHCNICDDGDYDLCTSCVSGGRHCFNEKHWLIKRSVKDGKVLNSTTERVAAQPKAEEEKKMPGAYSEEKAEEKIEEKKIEPQEVEVATRTCNSCVKGMF